MELEYSGMATANEQVTATNNQSKKLSYRKFSLTISIWLLQTCLQEELYKLCPFGENVQKEN